MKQFIICPNCGAIELATIEETVPFWTYIHDCTNCDYIIMESEWQLAKAISIKQPWAYLIASDIKDIENRTWKTNFRGRVLIHCGIKTVNPMWLTDEQMKLTLPKFSDEFPGKKLGEYMFPTSAIIGSVEIIDCVTHHPSIWAEKCDERLDSAKQWIEKPIQNWVLKDPVLFENPILNVKGKLSFFIPQLPENV